MKFTETPLAGAYVIDIEPHADERGFFARTVSTEGFAEHGLGASFVQQSISFNVLKGTLRGLHFQAAPHEEDKLVRVTRGAIFDVIVDLRKNEPTLGKWFGVELSAVNHRQLYIPKGFAHGFQTLDDNSEVLYAMTVPYAPGFARGVRWDDPEIGVEWPLPHSVIGARDLELPTMAESKLA
ncbi:dTDP-4-dehydrorhamnose 3,5-epimerase [Devosia sp.]|uniref:dTDP-4-dehydrorhamnose 3,5-epimerase n=1 Tax=Devosia sp. TaxID=1871048 RepID=UPI001ACDE02F|nr:dTDP-4-dehydrorhamnose 3,5-epimerase [Devosia sp.]MBN9332117.1 dTDP-4-dehydrorhamnose 3,5-epimerase [Devosia sp.]